jgi:DNA-damage-inducible protein J
MSMTNINIRVDSNIKSQAQDVLALLGLDMTTAINIFLRQMIRQHGIPFVITTEPEKRVQNLDGR